MKSPHEKSEPSAPADRSLSDAHREMLGHGSPFDASLLEDPDRANELLARWDELEPAKLAALRAHPIHGPRLERLELAQRWLEGAARETRAAPVALLEACPPAEELYDFGRGPGYQPLPLRRRRVLEAHLADCEACAGIVRSLVSRPPSPLILEPSLEADEPDFRGRPDLEEPAPAPHALRGPRRTRRFVPLAAAASVLALLGLWLFARVPREAGAAGLGLPELALLRGDATSSLRTPRGRLLHVPADAPAWLALSSLRAFELEASAAELGRAQQIRVVLRSHGASAFDEGRTLADHRGSSAEVPEQALLGGPLPPGRYGWEAWAQVNGLEERLGERGFEVVQDPELWQRLSALDARAPGDAPAQGAEPSVATRVEAIRLLHERGFASDAYALARRLPPSAERDHFLARVLGR